jgi:hypothetical protein
LGDALDVWNGAGEEVPGCGIGLPGFRAAGESIGPVSLGIESHCQQDQVSAHLFLETLLEDSEGVGIAEAEPRQGATGINEIDGYDLAEELRVTTTPVLSQDCARPR